MSLLLEALKKAEKAKEEAQRNAGVDPSPALQLQPSEPSSGETAQVTTRTQLPDISQPLEILSDDLAPKKAPGEAPRAAAPEAPSRSGGGGTDASLERAAARKVFEAKFKEPNPRLPFYIVLGVLGAFAVGTVGYFWYQLRPPAPLVNTNPKPSGNERPASVAAAPASPAGSTAGPITSSPVGAQIPGLPSAPAASVAPAPAVTPAPAAATPSRAQAPAPPVEAPLIPRTAPAVKERSPAPARAQARAAAEAPAPRAPAQVNSKVQSGYAAFTSGDLTQARSAYEEALRDEPGNRDALLGLAAIDTRAGRLESAEATYLRLLQTDPRDATAQAGLLSLRAGRVDPVAAESRIKTLLAGDPQAHVLNFALGNQLALQQRWAEAQQQYFKAFAADPENADYAYNLAVSLDHLRQSKPALEYYQRALSLAAAHGASFDPASARGRIAQLAR
ncbi:MAG: tetratricopeptide repeat protein [Betaproteobacteria bacterium]|nr:tetratricopeptide repeat protein [Betaproteobacteria bacterium]